MLTSDKKTAPFMAATQASSGQSLTLHELLEVPLRHVLKYPAMLTKCVQATDEGKCV